MDAPTRAEIQAQVRAALEAGRTDEAVTLALRSHERDVNRHLRKLLRSRPDLQQDAYADFSEKLWRRLPAFEWRCSLHAWMLSLAWYAAQRTREQSHVRREVAMDVDDEHDVWRIEAVSRAPTGQFMQTGIKNKARELRLQLPTADQVLLDLRVARNLNYQDIAIAMGDVAENATAEQLELAARRMAARFNAAKGRLRKLMEEAGLLAPA